MPGINSKNYRYVVTRQHYCYMYTECMYMYTHVPIALQTPATPLMCCTCIMYMYVHVARNTDTGNLVVRSQNGFSNLNWCRIAIHYTYVSLPGKSSSACFCCMNDKCSLPGKHPGQILTVTHGKCSDSLGSQNHYRE